MLRSAVLDRQEAEVLERLKVEVVADPDSSALEGPEDARAGAGYMLTEALVHELGHHHDRMRSRSGRLGHGERYAEDYARRVRAEVWDEYVRRLGL